MFSLMRNVRNLPKPQCILCVSHSTLRKPEREPEKKPEKEPEKQATETAQKVEQTPVKARSELSLATKYNPRDVTKEDMQWRTPWHKTEANHYTGLRAFYSEESNVDTMKLLQSEINLSPKAIKKWWKERKEYREMMLQSYLPERNKALGNELAAAHFIVYRGGAVKFWDEDKWIKADENKNYVMPRFFREDKVLQAIDCSDVNLYYEGLANFKELRRVEWLSFNGVGNFDDWFLDKISHIFAHSLVYLDIRNCPKYTERGLGALSKMEYLKILRIDDMLMTEPFEMTCLLLQEANPHLDIVVGDS